MLKLIRKFPKTILLIICIVLVLTTGILDYTTGSKVPFTIFYFLPLIIIVWYFNLRTGIFFSLFCLTTNFSVALIHNKFFLNNVLTINTIKQAIVFLIFVIVIYYLKKNLELNAKNKLIIQRSRDIISISQAITGLIVENISKHNSDLIFWINKQKENGKKVSNIIESTSQNIGTNLSALTEICFGGIISDKELDLEKFYELLQKKLKEVNDKNLDKS
jgi:hypothetical protein